MSTPPPSPNAPLFILLNAGSGHAETDLQRSTIEDVLRRSGRMFELKVVEQADQLGDVAQQMVERAKAVGGIVVAAGGDGTINTVARRALAGACPFGVLPQGTFNYFGRTHDIPEDLTEATEALLASTMQPVQVGQVNDRVFLVNASIGLYPTLLEERERDKQQFGRSRFVAFVSALKTIFAWTGKLRITLHINGVTEVLKTPTLFIGNNRLQMEQLGIEPMRVALDEGKLAAVALKPVGRLAMLGLILRGALGTLGEAEDLITFGFKSMTVKRPAFRGRKIKIATDGEVTYMATPLHFKVLEDQLLLLKRDPSMVQSSTEAYWARS